MNYPLLSKSNLNIFKPAYFSDILSFSIGMAFRIVARYLDQNSVTLINGSVLAAPSGPYFTGGRAVAGQCNWPGIEIWNNSE